MPLLLRGLDLPDNEIRASVIETLLATAPDTSASSSGAKDGAANSVTAHASSIVTTMLKNSTFAKMPSVVRL